LRYAFSHDDDDDDDDDDDNNNNNNNNNNNTTTTATTTTTTTTSTTTTATTVQILQRETAHRCEAANLQTCLNILNQSLSIHLPTDKPIDKYEARLK
jgi:hypothetical protein